MNVKDYIGDLVGGGLFLTESRIIAESLLKGLSDDKWKSLIIENNILQKKSGQTAIRSPEQFVVASKTWVISL